MSRLRAASANLSLSVLAIALLLLCFEAGTRLLARVGPTLIVKDARIGKRYVAGYDGDVYVPEAGRYVRLRFGRDGFRGPDRPHSPVPGVRRVAVLGDSMTVAVATDEERTFVRLLDRPPFEVLSFAVSSASTGQELVAWREVASRYQPEVVVCAFYVGNDFADNSVRLTQAPRLYFDFGPRDELVLLSTGPRASPVADWLDQHSRFYVWQKTAFAALRARTRGLRGTLDPGHRIFETGDAPELTHAWRMTERLLVALRDETRAHGASFVLLVVPCAEQIEDDVWQELVVRADGVPVDREHPERRLLEIGARNGLRVVPLAEEFRAASESELFLNHRHHLNDAGHRVVADVLGRTLADLK